MTSKQPLITPEMSAWYKERTDRHIELVNDAIFSLYKAIPKELSGLLARGPVHDMSKWQEPEITPYTHLTWRYRLKDQGKEYPLPLEMDAAIKQATLHHVTTNSHHPEYWDSSFKANSKDMMNQKDRDGIPDKKVDATKMDLLSLAEMVCDWRGMGVERGNTAKSWAEKVVNKRWQFTRGQTGDIYRYISILEP